MTTGNFLIQTGIYDKVISIFENPPVSDTRGQTFSRSARVFVIPAENTRVYTRDPGRPDKHWSISIRTTAHVHEYYNRRDLGVYLTFYNSHTLWSPFDSHIDSGSLHMYSHLMHQ